MKILDTINNLAAQALVFRNGQKHTGADLAPAEWEANARALERAILLLECMLPDHDHGPAAPELRSHTPGPWKVLADPEAGRLHLLHRNRWIVTAGAHFEEEFHPNQWHLKDGVAVATLRDTRNQAADSALIAAAPLMLQALKSIVALLDGRQPWDIPGALAVAGHALEAAQLEPAAVAPRGWEEIAGGEEVKR